MIPSLKLFGGFRVKEEFAAGAKVNFGPFENKTTESNYLF